MKNRRDHKLTYLDELENHKLCVSIQQKVRTWKNLGKSHFKFQLLVNAGRHSNHGDYKYLLTSPTPTPDNNIIPVFCDWFLGDPEDDLNASVAMDKPPYMLQHKCITCFTPACVKSASKHKMRKGRLNQHQLSSTSTFINRLNINFHQESTSTFVETGTFWYMDQC